MVFFADVWAIGLGNHVHLGWMVMDQLLLGRGIQYSIDKIEEYSNLALKAISNYPDSPIKDSLIDLVSYNGSRIK